MTAAVHPWTVAEAMLPDPTIHPADLTAREARAEFGASPRTHMLLLIHGGVLVSTVIRADVDGDIDPGALAADVGSLDERTVAPGAALAPAFADMRRRGVRRLAVVDGSARLCGLLCLKRSLTGFCTGDGVAEMRRARAASGREGRWRAPGSRTGPAGGRAPSAGMPTMPGRAPVRSAP